MTMTNDQLLIVLVIWMLDLSVAWIWIRHARKRNRRAAIRARLDAK